MSEGGGEEHVNSDAAIPSLGSDAQCPRGSPSVRTFEIQEPIQIHRREGLTAPSRSPEKPEPDAEPHMLMCTAERSAPAGVRAGLRLGLGQILLLSKNTTVHGCVLLQRLHLAD